MDDILKGNWKQLSGSIKEQWGKLTDDDIAQAQGRRDQLIGAIQKRYGYTREQAQQEVDNFYANLKNRGREVGR